MRKKNSYSRLIQDIYPWENLQKGVRIQLFHHCIENKITSFYLDLNVMEEFSKHLGTALSESGLSRDKIQLIGRLGKESNSENGLIEGVEKLLLMLRTDYLDLLLLDQESASGKTYDTVELLKSRGQIVETGSINGKNAGESSNSVNLWESELEAGEEEKSGLGELTSAEVIQFLILNESKIKNLPGLNEFENKYNLSSEELIYAWILHHPAQFHLVTAGKDQEEIDIPVKALNTQLIREDSNKISEIIRINISND